MAAQRREHLVGLDAFGDDVEAELARCYSVGAPLMRRRGRVARRDDHGQVMTASPVSPR